MRRELDGWGVNKMGEGEYEEVWWRFKKRKWRKQEKWMRGESTDKKLNEWIDLSDEWW